ncbi:PfkB family carbohydrate kinase [Ignavibacterium album JCM 16511]|uniref:PfkB family carbohydrate kinase n=1 Tax=Ignavibacterium album (strain DSM 19864 / JCM 16511 / NBRC 101810 / Mat9-16) TaxID=945713 RepID=I0AN56_IGNAJ|nr:carbohydrate kinase family protein [Ignavibacterium album]AFH50413.1 PfkB family carbohydrate kinase [Ignavibacterium album JCM 16511]
MKILLIGHSVFDTICRAGIETHSPGGIFYSANQILKLSSPEDKLFLCTQIDDNTSDYFVPVYSKFDLTFIEKVEAIPSVTLILDDKSERKEIYSNISSNLKIDKINFSDFDGILINIITGLDITSRDLKLIRSNTSALIFFDVHTLSRPMNQSGERVFSVVVDFDDWAKNIDILQANEKEFETLGNFRTEFERAKHLHSIGVKVILLTKDSKGAKVYFKKNGEILSYFISARKIILSNTVGCGDTFGATFFYNYIRTKNVYQSLSSAAIKTEEFLQERK